MVKSVLRGCRWALSTQLRDMPAQFVLRQTEQGHLAPALSTAFLRWQGCRASGVAVSFHFQMYQPQLGLLSAPAIYQVTQSVAGAILFY